MLPTYNFDEVSENNTLTDIEYRSLFRVLCEKGLRLHDICLQFDGRSAIGSQITIIDCRGNIIADITDYESW